MNVTCVGRCDVLCVCTYVCVVCVFECVYMYVYVCACACVHAHVCVCVREGDKVHTNIVCINEQTNVCTILNSESLNVCQNSPTF